MTDSISFINASWIWYVIGIAIVMYLIFLLKEWYQSKMRRFYSKAIIAFLGIFALSMLVLKPALEKEIDVSKMAIITKNYDKVVLDSLTSQYPNLRLKTYIKDLPILDKTQLPTSIFILGEGIAPFDLWQLDSIKTTYLNDTKPKGITRLTYEQEYIIGEKAIINGQYQNASKGHRLVLEHPGRQAIDSVLLTPENLQTFQLKADLNTKGQYTYSITEKDSLNKIITSNPVPFKISEQNALRILIINGFPTFETKYLKNYLTEMGHAVVVRSQITKGRFKYEYFNMQDRPKTTLTKSNLEQFDLVTMDANSLLNMSRSQRSNIENAIRDDGLGLLVQPTSRLFNASSSLVPFKFIRERISEIAFPDSQNSRISKHPYRFKSNVRLHPIHSVEDKILSAYSYFGTGRIATTVFENTFELVLNGKQKTHTSLWSDIITQVSKRKIQTTFWEQQDLFTFKDEPFAFKLRTAIEKPKVQSDLGYSIPIQQHIDISSVWRGTSYPKTSGWQKQRLEQDTTQMFHYFVNDPSDWQALQAYNTINANIRYSKNSSFTTQIQTTKDPIHSLWFYIIILISFGYLWLEPKL